MRIKIYKVLIIIVFTVFTIAVYGVNRFTIIVESTDLWTTGFFATSCNDFDTFKEYINPFTGKKDLVTSVTITNYWDKAKALYYFKRHGDDSILQGQGTDARVKVMVFKDKARVDTLCLDTIADNPIDINGRIVAGIPEMHRFFLRYVPKEYKLD